MNMGSGDNPFIKFKNYIDTKVSHGIGAVRGSFATSSTSPTPSHSDAKDTATTSTGSTHPSLPSSLAMMDSSSKKALSVGGSEQQSAAGATTLDDIHAWAINSPYSPLNLQHLPQPKPRNLTKITQVPFGHIIFPSIFQQEIVEIPAQFTFRDAFEDLLVAGSGEPLPCSDGVLFEIQRQPYASHSGIFVGDWVLSLEMQGRWDAYFHRDPELAMRRGGSMAQSPHLYFRPLDEYHSHWFSRPLTGPRDSKSLRDAVWRTAMAPEQQEGNANDANVEEELYVRDRAYQPIPDQVREREIKSGQRRREIQTLVENIRSRDDVKPSQAPTVTTTVLSDGSKVVKTVKHRTEGGKTEVTTKTQHFDARGYLFSETRETSVTRDWSGRLPGDPASASWSRDGSGDGSSSSSTSRGQGDKGGNKNGEDGGKGGWFW